MKTASLSHINNKVTLALSITAMLALMPTSSLLAQANEDKGCEYRTFNMKVNPNVSASEVLAQISSICNFSIIFADEPSAKIASNPLHGTYIKDKTLFEVFDILVGSNNLNYEYKNGVLKLSALETKSFKVDYITSIRQGTATMSASVSVAPIEDFSGERVSSDRSENQIQVKESFDFWKTIDAEIQAIVNSGRESFVAPPPIINSRAGLVTVTATKDQLKRVGEYFETLKKRLLKQVIIDVTILSVELNEDNRMGIDWSKFQLGFFADSLTSIFGINPGSAIKFTGPNGSTISLGDQTTLGDGAIWGGTGGTHSSIPGSHVGKTIGFDAGVTFNLEGIFNFLKEKGKTSVVSSPKVLTLNNQQALITVGDTINYQTKSVSRSVGSVGGNVVAEEYTNFSVFIGILLNLLPTVSDDNSIMLRINPSLSDFKYSEDARRQDEPRRIAPDTAEKKLSTVVNVKSGDTIVLGGLITNSNAFVNKGVPLLGDIPLLGYAFKYAGDVTATKELVFVITPRVIGDDTSSISLDSLSDLGYSHLGQ